MKKEQKGNEFVRRDGRNYLQIRPLELEFGLLNRVDGSARLKQVKTCIMTSVTGPAEVKARKEQIDKATIGVLSKPPTGQPTDQDREREHFLRGTFEQVIMATLLPRTSIFIVVQSLGEDGSALSCAINCVCAALLDAGIPLKSMIASVTCGKLKNEQRIILDPTQAEEKECAALFTFAFTNQLDGILSSKTVGIFTEEDYFNALEISKQACSKIFEYIRGVIELRHK